MRGSLGQVAELTLASLFVTGDCGDIVTSQRVREQDVDGARDPMGRDRLCCYAEMALRARGGCQKRRAKRGVSDIPPRSKSHFR